MPQKLKKTHLERLSIKETTSAVMRAVRKALYTRLPDYFEQTCDQRPQDTAVICGSCQLTYQELDQRANRLAHFLISHGAEKGDLIGILLDHSPDMYAVLLGVLKAGAAFVPLDSSFPVDLIAFIVQDSGLQGIVSTFAFREKTEALPCPVLELDRAQQAISCQSETRPLVRVDPASLCYITYTTDTVGRPRGVAVSHANIVDFLHAATPIFSVPHGDQVYQEMSIAFNCSFGEIWSAWITGASLILEPTAPQLNPTPFNKSISTLQLKARRLSSLTAEAFEVTKLKQVNFKNVYTYISTDPLYMNSIFNMASTFMLGALGFVFWIIIARLFKAEKVGIATTLISIMTLLCSFTTLGFSSSLNRYLPKSVNKHALINSTFTIVTIVTILVSAAFLLGLQLFSPQLSFIQSNIFYIVSFIVFIIFCSWNTLIDSVFMAFRSAVYILIKNTIISTLKLLLPFALFVFGSYGIFASAASAITFGVLASFLILLIRFKIKLSFSINFTLVKETSAYSFANYIANFMFNAPSLVLPVIILNIISAEYAAYYYIASMIQNILLIIPLATAQSLLTEGAYNEAELKEHVKKALATIFVMLTPALILVVFGGNILLQFFGRSYAAEAFHFLQLYSVSTMFTSLLLVTNAINNIKHRKKMLIISNLIASVLTLWLSYVFASGTLVGIGWGWTFGQVIAGFIAMIFILRELFY